jgi:tetratricopeptide (TPR) repeat protein
MHQKEIQSTRLGVWGRLFNEGVEAINRSSDSAANVDKAIIAFTTATIVMPESVLTRRNLGLAYYRKGDIPKAIDNLTIAFDRGKDLLACNLLGRIYLERANELRIRFTEAHREAFASIKNLANLHEKMKAADVKYLLGDPSEVNKPSKPKKGDTKEEWKYSRYNLIVSVDGDIVTAMKYSTPYMPKIDSADYKTSLVEFGTAVDILKKGQTMFPEDAEISENLMNAYIGAVRNEEARALLAERVRKYPDSKFDHYNLGVFLLKDSSYSEAIEQFKTALKIDTTFSAAVYNIAATYVNWGVAEQEMLKAAGKEGDVSFKERYKMALPYLEKVVVEKKDDIQMWELLGQVYANLNMKEKALQAYDKADTIRKGKN